MSYTDQPGSSINGRRLTNRNTDRYSVTTLFSMAAEQDVEVEDYLARDLKEKISAQSKNNVVLKRDNSMALSDENNMALSDEQCKVERTLEEVGPMKGTTQTIASCSNNPTSSSCSNPNLVTSRRYANLYQREFLYFTPPSPNNLRCIFE
ncbi:hypothetical protein K435DRAFT_971957 [Dendrothele bispora CBS 962.96]|uniref:Uncharacterized protein n=1 Tax=Dendrothele bispora (strain CBS 962.96) TaxID=1314807 RepID=A0A4S8L1Y8_DENBC|nr:hypothetical protein K435DRAFT_971957 [Dendrothele bispora CBS 962.96]